MPWAWAQCDLWPDGGLFGLRQGATRLVPRGALKKRGGCGTAGWPGGSAKWKALCFLRKLDPPASCSPQPGIAHPLIFPQVPWAVEALRHVHRVLRGMWAVGTTGRRHGTWAVHPLGPAPAMRCLCGPGILGRTGGLVRPQWPTFLLWPAAHQPAGARGLGPLPFTLPDPISLKATQVLTDSPAA